MRTRAHVAERVEMFRTLLKSVREYKVASIITPILVFFEVILECIIPMVIAELVKMIEQNEAIVIGDVLKYGLIVIILALLSLTFGAVAGVTAAKASCGFARNLRHDLYYAVQDFSFENIDRFSTSSLVTRLTTDVTNVQHAFMMIIRMAIRSPFMFIFAIAAAFMTGGKLAWIFLVVIPILGVTLFVIATKAMPMFRRVFKKYDNLNASVQENVKGMRVVKSFVREVLSAVETTEHGNEHGTGNGDVGGEGGASGTVHDAFCINVLHRIVVPRTCRDVGEGKCIVLCGARGRHHKGKEHCDAHKKR